MNWKYVEKDPIETWFTEGKIYKGEIAVSPLDFSGGKYLYIYRADDGHPAYAKKSQFIVWDNFENLNT